MKITYMYNLGLLIDSGDEQCAVLLRFLSVCHLLLAPTTPLAPALKLELFGATEVSKSIQIYY